MYCMLFSTVANKQKIHSVFPRDREKTTLFNVRVGRVTPELLPRKKTVPLSGQFLRARNLFFLRLVNGLLSSWSEKQPKIVTAL